MVSNIRKASTIIIATFIFLAMSILFSSEVNAATFTYDFGNGITVNTDKDMNPKGDVLHLPTGKNAVLKIKMDISVNGGATLQHAKMDADWWYDEASWELSGTSDSIDVTMKAIGNHKLTITTSSGEVTKSFFVWHKAPPKDIEIVTTNNKICFDTYLMDKSQYGDMLAVKAGDDWYPITLGMRMKDNPYIAVKANKTYNLELRGYWKVGDTYYYSPETTKITVKTGPATKPVIKSVKISKVKVTKVKDSGHWNSSGNWVYNYKTSYTVKVTLSKKAKNIKGIELSDGYNGYLLKGDKKTYTKSMSIVSEGFNHKGDTFGFTVSTYSDNKYMAYSPISKVKKAKIK